MAEGYNEWGDYGAEEEWQSRSTIRKIFSFRSFKKALKGVGYLFIIIVFALLAYRLCTGIGVPADTKKILWTEGLKQKYTNSTISVFEQEITENFKEDGTFGLFAFKYLPDEHQVQMTIRYNASTVKLLKEVYNNEITPDDFPFLFYLRDDDGNIYKDYIYSYYSKGLYTYVRLVYDNVDLFSGSTVPAVHPYFTVDNNLSPFIERGINQPSLITNNVEHLYLDFLYEDDVEYDGVQWATPLTVYVASNGLTKYDSSNEKPTDTTLFYQSSSIIE